MEWMNIDAKPAMQRCDIRWYACVMVTCVMLSMYIVTCTCYHPIYAADSGYLHPTRHYDTKKKHNTCMVVSAQPSNHTACPMPLVWMSYAYVPVSCAAPMRRPSLLIHIIRCTLTYQTRCRLSIVDTIWCQSIMSKWSQLIRCMVSCHTAT